MLLSLSAFGQQISWEEWETESKTDIRLLPKYGNVEKTEKQNAADKAFIETMLKHDSSLRKASNRFINLGFQFLYKNDIKTAMYRFNQAYVLDPTNTDVYWGFGAIYMSLGQYKKVKSKRTV